MLILRDVLDWPAAQVADLLDTTTTAVNSGLRRARAQLARQLPAEDQLAEPDEPARKELLDKFAAAFEAGDVAALAELLSRDAALEMPPKAAWFAGRDSVLRFLAANVFRAASSGARAGRAQFRVVPVQANAQQAFAAYLRGSDGVYCAHGVLMPTFRAAQVRRIVVFLDQDLFGLFGLPKQYGDGQM
jgi:RNA polymerase sigma-70 factor (ECF subfamily)